MQNKGTRRIIITRKGCSRTIVERRNVCALHLMMMTEEHQQWVGSKRSSLRISDQEYSKMRETKQQNFFQGAAAPTDLGLDLEVR